MNVPKLLTISASITAGVISLSLLISHVRDRLANTITFDGTPEQVEAAIRAQFSDPRVQEDAITSMRRRLRNVEGRYGYDAIVTEVRGDFLLVPEKENSLIPYGSDGSHRATVVSGDTVVDNSASLSVSPAVSYNTQSNTRVAQQ